MKAESLALWVFHPECSVFRWARWLSGPLRDGAEDLLAPAKLEQDGLLNAGPIRAAWEAHL